MNQQQQTTLGGGGEIRSVQIEHQLQELHEVISSHPLWQCRFLRACREGRLGREHFRYFFGQYFWYSRGFTRYLAGVMSACPDDGLRARLSQNLWEEGGGADPEQRHANLFRAFLRNSLSLEPEAIPCEDYTRVFVDRYLSMCTSGDYVKSTSFLGYGSEGIVARMYTDMIQGMRAAGFHDKELHFFLLHVGCDDDHALTLRDMLVAAAHEPAWFERARQGAVAALDARLAFFDAAFSRMEDAGPAQLIERIRARVPLVPESCDVTEFRHAREARGQPVYANNNERLNIRFHVERLIFPNTEVLDPRIVRIPTGYNNEKHRHAHESLFYVISGEAEVLIGESVVKAHPGDVIFVPRWVFHQSRNVGDQELVLFAITDFGVTSAVLGDYDRRTRVAMGGTDALPT